MEWALFGVTFTISFLLIVILGEHLRQKRKMKLRELQQKERMFAMEKGLTVPDINDDMFNEDNEVISNPEHFRRKLQWFRITLLAVGLFLIFGGLGMFLGFHFSLDSGFVEMSTLGIIPFMSGLGLLLFYYLSNKELS
jgi:hypothetical protein